MLRTRNGESQHTPSQCAYRLIVLYRRRAGAKTAVTHKYNRDDSSSSRSSAALANAKSFSALSFIFMGEMDSRWRSIGVLLHGVLLKGFKLGQPKES